MAQKIILIISFGLFAFLFALLVFRSIGLDMDRISENCTRMAQQGYDVDCGV